MPDMPFVQVRTNGAPSATGLVGSRALVLDLDRRFDLKASTDELGVHPGDLAVWLRCFADGERSS